MFASKCNLSDCAIIKSNCNNAYNLMRTEASFFPETKKLDYLCTQTLTCLLIYHLKYIMDYDYGKDEFNSTDFRQLSKVQFQSG
jgi:hypothetical protein